MNQKWERFIVVLLLVVLWFTLVSSIIDVFKISFAIIDMQDLYTSIELIYHPAFLSLANSIRLEGIQIAIAGGFLLVYFDKRRRC